MIVIFASTDTDFTTNGLGALPDATECSVTEEKNGKYELQMIYPIHGRNYDKIAYRRIIRAKPNPFANAQPFRIYSISRPINGLVTVNAEHISYDLSGYTISPFSASNVNSALDYIQNHSTPVSPFTFWTDKSTIANMKVNKPSSVRSILGGVEGSVLDTYRGEYEFDGYTVKLYNNRGHDNGVTIRYGKNLTDLTQEENCSNVYTAVYPFWYSEEDGLVELPDKIVPVEGTFDFVRILTLDLTESFDEKPTVNQLRSKTESYISSNDIGIPKVSLTVSFIQLTNSEEYRDYVLLETVRLCDTVTVIFPKLGVNAKAKCISTEYDVLANKYISIELGNVRANIVDTIADQAKVIRQVPTRTALEKAIIDATNLITGNSGGYVVMRKASDDEEYPSEILIMDQPSIEDAQKVWRWNSSGLGYSNHGYNGPYGVAITMNGAINADFITAGLIDGALIKVGTLEANSLSVEYKAQVDSDITNKVNSASEELSSTLTTAFTNADNALRAEFTQAFENQTTGGLNLLRNSSGLNGVSDDWKYDGAVQAFQNNEAISNTSSGSMFRINNGHLQQKVNVIEGKQYTLTCKARCENNPVPYSISIKDGSGRVTFVLDNADTEWSEYVCTFTADSETITLDAYTSDPYLYVADFMLIEGTQKANWTPAPNEIYTTNVKIDRHGINITNNDSSTETIIDNTQFAVKHNGEVVLSVNKDLTTLTRTNITDEVTIGRAKFITLETGVNFILID